MKLPKHLCFFILTCFVSALTQAQTGKEPPQIATNAYGYNVTWQVQGILSQPGSNICIYDKIGKLLGQLDGSGDGWDRMFNGKPCHHQIIGTGCDLKAAGFIAVILV